MIIGGLRLKINERLPVFFSSEAALRNFMGCHSTELRFLLTEDEFNDDEREQ